MIIITMNIIIIQLYMSSYILPFKHFFVFLRLLTPKKAQTSTDFDDVHLRDPQVEATFLICHCALPDEIIFGTLSLGVEKLGESSWWNIDGFLIDIQARCLQEDRLSNNLVTWL